MEIYLFNNHVPIYAVFDNGAQVKLSRKIPNPPFEIHIFLGQ
jgi:hypothetical protein